MQMDDGKSMAARNIGILNCPCFLIDVRCVFNRISDAKHNSTCKLADTESIDLRHSF